MLPTNNSGWLLPTNFHPNLNTSHYLHFPHSSKLTLSFISTTKNILLTDFSTWKFITLQPDIHTEDNMIIKFKKSKTSFPVPSCVSFSVLSDSLQPRGLQHARLFCPRGFSRQEYWSGLPCPPPGDLFNPETESRSLTSQADSLPSEPSGKPPVVDSLSILQRIFPTQELNWRRSFTILLKIFQ